MALLWQPTVVTKLKIAAGLVLIAATQSFAQCVDQNIHPFCCFWYTMFDPIGEPGWSVHPNATCDADSGTVNIEMVYTTSDYPPSDIRIDLFYVCTNEAGTTTGEPQRVPDAWLKPLDSDAIYEVVLNETFIEPGASCTIFGCYEPNLAAFFDRRFHEMEDSTCTFSPQEVVVMPTIVTTSTAATPHPTTTVSSYLATTVLPSITPTVQETDPNQMGREKVTIVTLLVVFLSIAGVSILVLLGILLRFRQVQRRKQSLLWFYDYSEPIDPFFNPVSITSPIKQAVSVVSIFDTFPPVKPDSSDDDKSEVLQGTDQPESDDKSMRSIVFDDSGIGVNYHTSQEETDAPVEDLGLKEPSEPTEKSNGYVANMEPDNQQSALVSNGYVLESKAPTPLPIPMPEPVSGDYVAHEDASHAASMTLDWNRTKQNEQFRTKLNSTSSGYVTDLSGPDCRSYPGGLDVTFESGAEESEPSVKPAECKYTTLNNGYTVVESQQHLKGEVPQEEELDTMYCNEDLDDSSEGEGEEEQQDSENVVTECSLSINPLHFEPVNYDELMQGHASPSYVNTASVYATQ